MPGWTHPHRGYPHRSFRVINKPLCAPLLISSVRKTDLTAAAAEVRGFRLRTRESGYKRYPFTLLDLCAAAFCALILAAAILL